MLFEQLEKIFHGLLIAINGNFDREKMVYTGTFSRENVNMRKSYVNGLQLKLIKNYGLYVEL